MVNIPVVVGGIVSVCVLLMTVAVLYLTYLSTKQDYEVKTGKEESKST